MISQFQTITKWLRHRILESTRQSGSKYDRKQMQMRITVVASFLTWFFLAHAVVFSPMNYINLTVCLFDISLFLLFHNFDKFHLHYVHGDGDCPLSNVHGVCSCFVTLKLMIIKHFVLRELFPSSMLSDRMLAVSWLQAFWSAEGVSSVIIYYTVDCEKCFRYEMQCVLCKLDAFQNVMTNLFEWNPSKSRDDLEMSQYLSLKWIFGIFMHNFAQLPPDFCWHNYPLFFAKSLSSFKSEQKLHRSKHSG